MHWKLDKSMLIGIESIDEQHQHLIDILNRLSTAITKGVDRATIGKTLDELSQYTQTHFAAEEEEFALYGYPEAEQHAHAHDALVEKLNALKHQHTNNQIDLTQDLLDLLVDWVFGHIKGSDACFGVYLESLQQPAH